MTMEWYIYIMKLNNMWWSRKKMDKYIVLEIPKSGEDFDNGKAFDYPKDLPLPRIGETISWCDWGIDKSYYLKVIDIRHSLRYFTYVEYAEIRIICEFIK